MIGGAVNFLALVVEEPYTSPFLVSLVLFVSPSHLKLSYEYVGFGDFELSNK